MTGNGKTMIWLREHVSYSRDGCLFWPFSRKVNSGYGQLGYRGKMYYAHRLMCELAHGAPPTPKHEAAHSCGNGGIACVNPRHLSWKTSSENHRDRRAHGTAATNTTGKVGKLSVAQKRRLVELAGRKTKTEIAAVLGVNRRTVARWIGRLSA